MVFDSLFGKKKKEAIGQARVEQFRAAWLQANRGMLAALAENANEDTQVEEIPLVEKARQILEDSKQSFTAEAHHIDQLADRLLPVVEQLYAISNRYTNDADVSSAHNTTFTRILELVSKRAATGEPIGKIPSPPDFTDAETELLASVSRILNEFWESK